MTSFYNQTDQFWMTRALHCAQKAETYGEVPVGAVIVQNNELIAEGYNQPIRQRDATAHAEIMAIREAGNQLNNYRLPKTTLYVTLEPCSMCVGAIIHARIERLVFGAPDPKTGAVESVCQLAGAPHHNHRLKIQGGVLADACGDLLRRFFKARR